MLLVMTTLLGRTTSSLSGVLKEVCTILISRTMPSKPLTRIKSPTLNGRNRIISAPAAKFDSWSFKDKATAKPAPPIKAVTEVVGMPSLPSAAMMMRISKPILATLPRKLTSVLSILARVSAAFISVTTRVATQRPIKKMAKAASRFVPKDIPTWARCSQPEKEERA